MSSLMKGNVRRASNWNNRMKTRGISLSVEQAFGILQAKFFSKIIILVATTCLPIKEKIFYLENGVGDAGESAVVGEFCYPEHVQAPPVRILHDLDQARKIFLQICFFFLKKTQL
jgi:hypothetical protein